MTNKALHIIITCCLLLSITESSKVLLLVYSSLHNNGCSVLMCTCSTACSCSGHSSNEMKKTEIPLLIPPENPKTSSCCPTTGEKVLHTQAKVCSCGASTNPKPVSFIQSLDKVTFLGIQPYNVYNNFPSILYITSNTEWQNPYREAIFHPPRLLL